MTVTFMLGQDMDSNNRQGPIAEGGQPCTTDSQRKRKSGAKASPSLKNVVVGGALKVRCCCPVQTLRLDELGIVITRESETLKLSLE